MKYCPTCETRYDEEILRFCMKDGTPLIEEDEPAFIHMPSESIEEPVDDDPAEVTIIRKNVPVPPPPPSAIDEISFTPDPTPSAQRIVVPTTEEDRGQFRARVIPPYQAPQQSNTAKVVVLTIIGTVAVLAIGALGFQLLQNGGSDNSNINTNFNSNIANVNTNVNTNLGFDANFNFNTNANFNTNSLSNLNTNVNANLRTPTPTPKPSPSATATPTPTPDEDTTPTPTPTPTPTQTPIVVRPNTTPTPPRMMPANRPGNGGVLNGRALTLPTPTYPPIAKQMRASGEVRVQVAVDERGNVVSAHAVSGHPLLRQSAEMAARRSKIRPNGQNELGELVYHFKVN